ncbi:hypothetical protein FHR90_001041 [Endobacter medicaginis]|jgi:Rap1a immunity proteins|uniref:Rap1a immunity protein domain-containing protein n=1 Tax=Endobacter medicaginis TaxID=1181271 RepID=A0A850NY51_9PROT|nr:Rap1a/Tai family immunity protein [Endobacter medicaginis]MBB3173223.1 hypothetical protein [Endobacter medicaginis]MCX5476488.1 Rap1a/Tai family immunity protein [Endobacter medicaginis]NVN30827.1 hypothetical protein [Endobacter medicaginis]
MRRLAVLLAAASLCATPALAQRISPVNGRNLLAMCSSHALPGQKMCEAYVSGIADMIGYEKASSPDKAPPVCIPDAITGGQLRQTAADWLEGHKDLSGERAARQVYEALKAAYPCKG